MSPETTLVSRTIARETPLLVPAPFRIEYVAAFPEQDACYVRLCAETDKQHDRLGTENPLLDEVRRILMGAGFTARQLTHVGSTGQSQETVDRSYEGSWFYALR